MKKPGGFIPVFPLLAAAAVFLAGCGGESSVCKTRAESGALIPGCSDSHRPVIFVHGFLGSGDNYADMVQRFLQNGYCPEKLVLLDWNGVGMDVNGGVRALSARVDELIAGSGFTSVDLVGHSMGGFVGANYVNITGNAAKIAHYLHAASNPYAAFPAGLKVRSISSHADTVAGFTDVPGVDNREIPGADHMQVVSQPEAFAEAYEFFNDGAQPVTTAINPQEEKLRLEGKAVSLGDNLPLGGGRIEIFPVDPATGERTAAKPEACFLADAEGKWGVFEAEKEVFYEMALTTADGRTIHYYRQPFRRSQPAVYLRGLGQAESSITALITSIVPYNDNMGIMILFASNQAIYSGRDTASVDGYDLATPELSSPAQSSIAYFLSDENLNGASDYTQSSLSAMNFLADLDYYIPVTPRRSVRFEVNGSVLNIPNWKSDTEGVSLAVFDY